MIFKNLFNPFKKLVSLIEKKEYENAMQHIFLNPDLSKQNYFMHVCAYSKNFDLINFALKYKPSFSCSDEDFNPLHFLAHLGSFLYESKSGHGLDFVTVPYEYNNLGKHRYSYRLKHKYFDPRCIKLLDKKREYMYQIKGVNSLAPIDICLNQLNVVGFKDFLDNGINLKKLIKIKKKNNAWRYEQFDIGDQYYFANLVETTDEVSKSNLDKVYALYNLISSQGLKINLVKIDKFLKANDYPTRTRNSLISNFKKLIR